MFRVFVSFLALPLTLAAASSVLLVLSGYGTSSESLFQFRIELVRYLMVAYGAIGVLGVPAFLAARRLDWLSLWHTTVMGGVLGAATAAWVAIPAFAAGPFAVRLLLVQHLALPIVVGGLHGLVFWALALWRNPGFKQTHPPGVRAA